MDCNYHLKYLKSLIKGSPKKKPSDKKSIAITPGSWSSNNGDDFYLVGVPTEGAFHITWRHKDGVEIDKLQSMVNFSYIAALNPAIMLEIIEEVERLKKIEDGLQNI